MGYKAFLFKEWLKDHKFLIGFLVVAVSTSIIVPVAVKSNKKKTAKNSDEETNLVDNNLDEETNTQENPNSGHQTQVNTYTVTFNNYNGNFLQSVVVEEGGTAVYTGATPYRSSTTSGDYTTSYTFTGWSPSTTNVHSDLTVTAQFSSHQQYNGVSDKQRVINYLKSHASSNPYLVSTGTGTHIGYESNYDQFVVTYSNFENFEYYTIFTFNYNATYINGNMTIKNGYTTYFDCSLLATISSHQCSNVEIKSITTNRFSSSDSSNLATIIIGSTKLAFLNGYSFLRNNDLPYIY